jgi:THO complex subunit 2
MAPPQHKRKRPQDDHQTRASPHRPENLNLAQQNQRNNNNNNRRNGNPNQNRSNNSTPTHNRHGNFSQPGSARNSPAQTPHNPQQNTQPQPPQQQQQPESVRPALNSTPSATPAPPLVLPQYPPTPKEPPAPYAYDYLTDDVVSAWHAKGRQSVLDALENVEDKDMVSNTVIQELLRTTLDGRLSAGECAEVLKQVAPTDELQSVFGDTLALLDDIDWKNPVLKTLIHHAGLSAHLLRNELDIEPLSALGLVRNTFSTIRNRKTTNLIYRQANFNLLREESEGYSKLITEYFHAANAGLTSDLIAEDTFQRIKALVGSFDLDVGRVLDITLDVMANLLIKNFRFFIKYLRASSWWPEQHVPEGFQTKGQGFTSLPAWALPHSASSNQTSEQRAQLAALKEARDIDFWQQVRKVGMEAFFDIGALRITNLDASAVADLLNTEIKPELDARGREMNMIRRLRTNNARKWMRQTGCIVPPGNSDAAQLLGFKLAFYSSAARDKHDVLPDNLIYLAAFLIKIGFISLRDLYPHLYPPDEKMGETKERLEKEKLEREKAAKPGGGALNALAMAGALADDSAPAPHAAIRGLRDNASGRATPKAEPDAAEAATEDGEKEALPEPANQKIALVKSLLAIGCLPEALYILGRFPWLTDLVHELPDYIHRVLHHMLTKVYEPARPLADRPGMNDARPHIGDPTGLPKGQLNLTPSPPTRTLRWANLDRPDYGDAVEYKFYWDDWIDNIPICQSVDDVFQLCSTFLNLTGVKIGRDSALLMKLARIGKKSLTDDSSDSNYARWIDLCKRLLVPALSLTKHNTGDVNEMFELLKFFPTSTRYSIYAEWHYGNTSRLPDIKSAFDLTKAETKDVLKRISKTNVRAMGKALSKVAFSSPGIVMQVAIHQMESYDNLIDVVVECVRYFSMLGYDVLTWCLMNALGGGGRNRVQADGMLTSPWLRALSTFAGSIFKRYSAMDPSPILQYVTNELRAGNSTDLEVLEQIITEMVGIKSDMTFNESQVLAMAGGPVLKAQTLISLLDERHKMEKPSRRLVKALTEPGLAGQLLISVAQESQMYAHHESTRDAPLKVLGNNMDKLYQVFNQYLETLRSTLQPDEFDAVVPDTVSLMGDFGLEPAIAFMIGRASIAHAIAESDAAKRAEQQARRSSQSAAAHGDISMADADEKDVKTEAVASPPTGEKPVLSLTETDAEMKSVAHANGVDTTTPTPSPETHWHPVLTPLIERTRELLGDKLEQSISIPFYVTFWTLGLDDILVNTNSYDQELATQSHLINQINNDRNDVTGKGMQEKDRRKKAISELREKLTQEMKSQIGAYTQVRNRLNKEKDHWFTDFHNKVELLHTSLLQNCFLPRMMNSPLDAHYTYMMLKFLHNNGAPGFRTMHLLDRLLRKNQLSSLMFQCTPRESENFGRFLNEVLKELSSWHAEKTAYEKNAFGAKRQLTGFARKLNPDNTPQTFLNYEEYRVLLYKWHSNLNAAFQMCLDSGEYMHIRNAIIVFKAVAQQFPVAEPMGKMILDSVTALSKADGRADLKLAAASTLGDIRKRQSSWVSKEHFTGVSTATPPPNNKSDVIKKPDPNAKPVPSRAETPASRTSTPLNPAAQAFKAPPLAAQQGESEDGEIDDDKQASSKASADGKSETLPERKAALRTLPRANEGQSRAHTPSQRDDSRASSAQPARMPHSLPSKPDVPVARQPRGAAQLPARHNSRERGHTSEYGRLDRPNDAMRGNPTSMPREASPPGARGGRTRQRSPEYPPRDDRRDHYGRSQPPVAEPRTAERDQYGPARPHPGRTLLQENNRGYPSGPSPMAPPPDRSGYDRSDRPDRTERHERADRERSDRPSTSRAPSHPAQSPQAAVVVNPERLALIAGDVPPTDRRSRDSSRDDRRSRDPRPQSPKRAVDLPPPAKEAPRRQPLDPNPFAARENPRVQPEKVETPTGPAAGRAGRGGGRNDVPAKPAASDLFEPATGPRRAVNTQMQDPNYGRLSSAPELPSGPPLGPKGYGNTNPRNFSGQGVPNGRPGDARDVPYNAPQEPSSNRNNRRPHHDRQGSQQAQFQSQPPVPPPPPGHPPQHEAVGIHPTRLSHLDVVVPQNTQQNTSTPTGPRMNMGGPSAPNTPSGPLSATARAPAGPASDRRINGSDRRFAGLNDTLQSASANGASIRGRAGGRGQGQGPNPMMSASAQPSPISTQSPAMPSPAMRNDFPTPTSSSRDQGSSRRHEDRDQRDSRRHGRDGGESRQSNHGGDHGHATPNLPAPSPQQSDDYRHQSSNRAPRSSRGGSERDGYNGGGGGGGRTAPQTPTLSSVAQPPQGFAVPHQQQQMDPSSNYNNGGRNRGYEGEDRGSDYHRRESRGGNDGNSGRRDDGNGSHRRGGNDDGSGRRGGGAQGQGQGDVGQGQQQQQQQQSQGQQGQGQGQGQQGQGQGRSERKRRGEGELGGHEGKRRR